MAFDSERAEIETNGIDDDCDGIGRCVVLSLPGYGEREQTHRYGVR